MSPIVQLISGTIYALFAYTSTIGAHRGAEIIVNFIINSRLATMVSRRNIVNHNADRNNSNTPSASGGDA